MTTIECPKCRELSLSLKYPVSKCDNCHKVYKSHELLRKWSKVFLTNQLNVTQIPNEKFVTCPECFSDTMIMYKKLNQWICFTCLNSWKKGEPKVCKICQMYSQNMTESAVCSDCIDIYGDEPNDFVNEPSPIAA